MIKDSFSYPFRQSGKYMLIIGGVLSMITSIAMLAPVFGIFAYVFLASYFCSTYFTIIESTAVGDNEAPQFPDVSNILEDLIFPLFKVIFLALISWLPYILCLIFLDTNDFVELLFFFLGCAYFPMSLLAVSILGYIGAASPLIIIPSILRAGWMYWLSVVLLVGIYYIEGVLSEILSSLLIVNMVIMGFVGMYVLMTSARILGLLYREKEEDLNWI